MGMLNIRIVGERLPGRTVGAHTNVHVGVQRGDDLVQLQPADAASVKFTFGIVLREPDPATGQELDFRSPFVHGKPGERFFYLVWTDVDAEGTPTERIGRAKLMLADLPKGLVTARTGTLEAYLSLTDAKGGPLCAAVRPPAINWSSGG
jgi:hypothetical protein